MSTASPHICTFCNNRSLCLCFDFPGQPDYHCFDNSAIITSVLGTFARLAPAGVVYRLLSQFSKLVSGVRLSAPAPINCALVTARGRFTNGAPLASTKMFTEHFCPGSSAG